VMSTDVEFLAKLEKWPDDPFGTLQATHRIAFQRFSVMEPSDFVDHEIMGRRWTTRRVMRRMLEHEFEHYGHIKEIMAALGGDRRWDRGCLRNPHHHVLRAAASPPDGPAHPDVWHGGRERGRSHRRLSDRAAALHRADPRRGPDRADRGGHGAAGAVTRRGT